MFSGKRILFISKYCGFGGGLERYLYLTAALLRSQGAEVWLGYDQKTHHADLFEQIFTRTFCGSDLPQESFDLAAIHGIASLDYLQAFLNTYGDRSALFMHNYEYYCPRQCKLFPVIQTTCRLQYHSALCGLCGTIKRPSEWKGGFENELKQNLIQFKDRLDFLKRYPRIVVVSPFMRDSLLTQGFSPNTMHVIPPAIPVPVNLPPRSPREIPQILFMGRLEREKGVEILLKVLSKLHQPFQATIVGNGSLRDALKLQARKLGIADAVQIQPWIPTADDFFAETDLLLAPSLWEAPFNISVVEAAAWGVPSIAFRSGDIPNILIDGQTGYAVAHGDLDGMAERTDTLLSNFELRQQMGNAARQHILDAYAESRLLRGFQRLLK